MFGPAPDYAGVTLGHTLTFGGAAGILAAGEKLQIGPELYGNSVLSGDDKFDKDTTNLELLFGLVQALVFALLSMTYITLAIAEHRQHGSNDHSGEAPEHGTAAANVSA